MASSQSDKLLYAGALVEDTLAAAISSGTDLTCTISNSWSTLTNGEFYCVTIDRVEPGTTTATGRREVAVGQWNSATKQFTFTLASRGLDGTTARDHELGKKVEILMTAHQWNQTIDAIRSVVTTAGVLDTTKVADLASAQTLSNKTLTAPTLSGSIAGTYTLAGTPTLTSPTISAPVLSGTVSGTYNLSGTPTLTTPTVDDGILLTHETTVSTPASGKIALFAKNDNKIYKKDSGGAESEVGGSSGILTTTSYAPEGFLINGRISVSVASNNLTVAIKGMDGNDPSGSNVVRARLDNVTREITSALSVTLNSGTDWFNLGASGHSAKPVYFYVSLLWNSSGSDVRLAFHRVMKDYTCALYSSTANTEVYLAATGAFSSSDKIYPIGMIYATNSGSASFNWSAPGIYTDQPTIATPWIEYLPTYSASGSMTYTSVSTTRARYRLVGRTMQVRIYANGTTGGVASTRLFFTLPLALSNYDNNVEPGFPCFGNDSSNTILFMLGSGISTMSIVKSDGTNWGLGSTRYFVVSSPLLEI